MAREWHELTRLTDGQPFVVERVRMTGSDIAIDGSFELPPVMQLSAEDLVFVAAFIKSHGSIKEMERVFGVSYPTVKNRLNRISESLPLVESDESPVTSDVLQRLREGEISADEAVESLSR